MTSRKVARKVTVWLCTCERCGHKWESIGANKPTRCAGCKTLGWEKPARAYVRKDAAK